MAHEAELASLKRKWERIMKRSAAVGSDSVPSSPEMLPNSPFRNENKSAGLAPAAEEVVGVIRDGVQGLGRMLVLGGLGSSSINTATGTASTSKSDVDDVARTPGSRSSSLSSSTVTSSTTTERSSLSSATSVTPSDAEGESSSPSKYVSEDGDQTLTRSARSAIEGSVSGDVHEPVECSASERLSGSTARPPSLLFSKLFDESDSSWNSSPSKNIGDRISKKRSSARLTSSPTPSFPWSDINKKWEKIQKTDT